MSQQQHLEQILMGCLHSSTVQQAEASLLTFSRSPTFLQTLYNYISSGIPNHQVLILAVTTYKNYLKQYYNHATTPIPPNKRQVILSTCQQLYFKISHSNVAVNVYKQILYILVAVSYPWEGLDLTKQEEIEPNSLIFEQIGVVFEYLLEDNYRNTLELTINQYFPMIQEYIKLILQSYSDKTVKILYAYLSMLFSSSHMELPQYFRSFQKINLWLFYLKTILNYNVTLSSPHEQNYFVQNQILATKIIRNWVAQHIKDNSDQQHLTWVNSFISQFANDIFSTMVEMLYNKKEVLHADVLSNVIRTMYSGYKNSLIRPIIMGVSEKIMFEEMMPLIDYPNEDLGIFNHDALEFIRRQEDHTVNPVRWEAIELINSLLYIGVEGKSFLMKLIEYAAGVLKDPGASFNRKTTVLFLITEFKPEILKNKILKQQFGSLVTQYFFPYLYDSNPILVYITCRLFSVYLIQVSLQTPIIKQLISKLFDCLSHQSIPVRFMSVLAFTSLLQDDSDAIEFVKPHFSLILKNYLSLIQQIDHQCLLKALQKMVKFFDKEILDVGPKLIKHLIDMFYKYADKQDKDAEQQQVANFLENPVTASLGTIKQLFDVELDKQIYSDASQQILDILIFVVKKGLKYCYEDIYDIFAVMCYRGDQVSDWVFVYLFFRKVLDGTVYQTGLQTENWDVINGVEKADPCEQESVLSVLKNMIVKMPREILFSYPLPNHPALILCLVEHKILETSQLSTLDFTLVIDNWLPIIKSYVSIIYSINTVQMDPALIKSFPSSISFYPWLSNISDLSLFISIIRKVMNRYDDDQDQHNSHQELTTLQMMEKYAEEGSGDEESDFEDGAYHEDECSYSYKYDSPFGLKRDLVVIREKLGQMTGEQSQMVVAGLGKREYEKLVKLVAEVDQGKN